MPFKAGKFYQSIIILKMFFLIQRLDSVAIHPQYFGVELHQNILKQLRLKVEDKFTPRYGYTLLVTKTYKISPGRLHEDTSHAHFDIEYQALVFRMFKNQIVIGNVTSVNRDGSGMMVDAGPVEIFISDKLMPNDLKYNTVKKGFFSEQDSLVEIVTGSQVRVKIIGMRLNSVSDKMIVIGSIKHDFLG